MRPTLLLNDKSETARLTLKEVGFNHAAVRDSAVLEQADIVLMHDKIENVEEAFVLSRGRARLFART